MGHRPHCMGNPAAMVRPETSALVIICGWETIALTTGRLPTWTSLLRPLPRRYRAVVVAAASVWFAQHLDVWR